MFYRFAKVLLGIIIRLIIRFRVEGVENEPTEGRLIVAANHHSAWDPIFVGLALRRQLRFMAKVELFKYPVFKTILYWLGAFPVNRGTGDSRAIRSALAILKNNEVLAMFPEGTRVKAGEAREAQSGIALLAAKTGAPVLPVRVLREHRKVVVRIGKPVKFTLPPGVTKASKDGLYAFSQDIMARIRDL
ncbi:MAG: 1-acyl-sn-glycerol-3-phosphate acyltransferase [Firmicutes bacterium]|nr:1-acyl-sn-glycerol-3-phosphate acyltransferase [Bacillota bacterium]